jgi:hypothetical protein
MELPVGVMIAAGENSAMRHRLCGLGLGLEHRMFLRLVKNEFGLSPLDTEELVNLRVHFVTDSFARLQAHDDKLGVRAGE